MNIERIIYGKYPKERVIGCEVTDSEVELFINDNGVIKSEFKPFNYWILTNKNIGNSLELEGSLYYKYITKFSDKKDFQYQKSQLKRKNVPYFCINDDKESAMVMYGFTYFKGLTVKDVSVLSFDIETTGLEHNNESKVLLISNTFKDFNGNTEKKLFAYDDYPSDIEFFEAWSDWVRLKNPDILTGHNILGYDLPYMNYCASMVGADLKLGRDDSIIKFNKYPSKFRKDQQQYINYNDCHVYGREIVDTQFLTIKYDLIHKKYQSYGLKNVIKQEGLEKQDRQFYDASKIRINYKNPVEWAKIKEYCIDDSDDALALYELMIPSYFYLNQMVPKPLQAIVNGATGSQVNSVLIRSYLQDGHSIPDKSESSEYTGAISFGNPGIYKYCQKVDVASLYPSIIITHDIYNSKKDPKAHFLHMVKYLTKQRLEYKRLGKETGDRKFKDLDQSSKICVNSAYGFLGTNGLLFNSPEDAAKITRIGKEILTTGLDWVNSKDYVTVNADTDSFTYSKGYPLERKEIEEDLKEINSLFPSTINWEDDGYYDSIVVVKAKNYILNQGGKIKTKGSALKVPNKEPALKEFVDKTIRLLVDDKPNEFINVYNEYVKEILNLKDIKRWAHKKGITEKIINAKRANEQKVLDALKDREYSVGDKVYLYFDNEENLRLADEWKGDHDTSRLLEKLFKTGLTFQTLIDKSSYINYKLKKNRPLLEALNQL